MRHGILSGSPPGRGGTVQEVQPGAAFGGDERAAFPAVVFKTGAVDRDVVSGQLNRAENPQPRAGREMKRSPAGNLQRLHKIGRGREPERPFARIEPFLQGIVGGGRGRRVGPGGEAAAGACFPIPGIGEVVPFAPAVGGQGEGVEPDRGDGPGVVAVHCDSGPVRRETRRYCGFQNGAGRFAGDGAIERKFAVFKRQGQAAATIRRNRIGGGPALHIAVFLVGDQCRGQVLRRGIPAGIEQTPDVTGTLPGVFQIDAEPAFARNGRLLSGGGFKFDRQFQFSGGGYGAEQGVVAARVSPFVLAPDDAELDCGAEGPGGEQHRRGADVAVFHWHFSLFFTSCGCGGRASRICCGASGSRTGQTGSPHPCSRGLPKCRGCPVCRPGRTRRRSR